MSKHTDTGRAGKKLWILIPVIAVLIIAATLVWLNSVYVYAGGLHRRDSAQIDLRGKSISEEKYLRLREQLPDCKIYWDVPIGGAVIDCELRLLCAAVPGGYDYYHLLSGVDVPVKTRQYIENYFSSVQPGTNFVHFQHKEIIHDHRDRVKFYYPLQRWNLQNRIIRLALRRTGELLQRPFVDRTKKDPDGYIFQKGANWFSITHALATYVLSQENWLRERYRSTFCADEIFLQTLVVNSPFRDTLPSDYFGDDHKTCLRYIDWQRGKPYSFRNEDYGELIATPPEYLFARKFDYRTNAEVVDRLFAHFGEEASD